MRPLAVVAFAALAMGNVVTVSALDNGLAITPPLGWRSWNYFRGDINDPLIRGQVDAMLSKRPVRRCAPGPGAPGRADCSVAPTSLLALGYRHAGIDDGWQECDSYTVEPSGSPAFHDASGKVNVNLTRFPDLKALASYAAARGVDLGWYNNNCICHESAGHIHNDTWRELSYHGDVRQLVENNFKGVKIDNCGLHNDLDYYAALMNATGKAFLVEHVAGNTAPTNRSWCPYNMFRSSNDIRPSWSSIHRNLHTTQRFVNVSRPGCWAYPDMLMVGNLKGPLADVESRTHFGAWCIVSSPLILGLDLNNETSMAAAWPYIANPEAIQVNQQWAGDPGRVLNISSVTDSSGSPATRSSSGAPAVEVWAKLQPSGAVALLAINTDATGTSLSVSVDLSKAWPQGAAPAGWCSTTACTIRDVWKQANAGKTTDGVWHVKVLAPHDSDFVLISPS